VLVGVTSRIELHPATASGSTRNSNLGRISELARD
jgi:hypothetical protein